MSLIIKTLILILVSYGAIAQEARDAVNPKADNSSKPAISKKAETPLNPKGLKPVVSVPDDLKNDSTRFSRFSKKHGVQGLYSFIDTWIPSKIGFNYTYNSSVSSTYEIEYLRGSYSVPLFIIDLGAVTDQRISLLYRDYSGRSAFHLIYGLYYNSFDATLGSNLLSNVTSNAALNFDVLSVETAGLTFGLGNRWALRGGLTLGVDWFTINFPVVTVGSNTDFIAATNDAKTKKDIQDALDIIKKFPTFSALKINLGYTF